MNSATSQYHRVHGMVWHQALSVLTDLVRASLPSFTFIHFLLALWSAWY